jgi:hypothetical protein
MATKPVGVYLRCNEFYNPNGRKCKGKLDDVGAEGSGKYKTRLRCSLCCRTITIDKGELKQILEKAKPNRSSDDD